VFQVSSAAFAAIGIGDVIDVSSTPQRTFALQVKGSGAAPTSWDVRLEGSLDGVNFTQIIQHTQVDGDGVVKWGGSDPHPSLFWRVRVAALSLGPAADIVVTSMGVTAGD
jgi:hypothetical protein